MYKEMLEKLNKVAEEGRVSEARSIYMQLDEQIPAKQRRTTCNTVLKAFANAGKFVEALEWFEKMQRDGVQPNEKGMGKLLEAAAKAAATDQAELFLEKVDARFTANVVKWNLLIDAYAKYGLVSEAMQALTNMKFRRVVPDLVTFNTLVNACAKGHQVPAAQNLVQGMAEYALQPDIFTYTAFLDALAAKGDVDAASRVLADMRAHAVVPELVSYTTVIKACAKAADRDGRRAVEACLLLAEMRTNTVEQNAASFNVVIEACARAHELKAARACLALLDGTPGLAADAIAYTSVLNALGSQRVVEAEAWFEHMKGERVSPDTIAYNSLLNAFASATQPEQVISYLEEMKLEGVPRTSATYASVIGSVGAAKQADEAFLWFENMLAETVHPNSYTFQSLVTLCGSVSPPRADLIERILSYSSNLTITPRTAVSASRVLGDTRFAELQKQFSIQVSGWRQVKSYVHNAGYLERRRETRLQEVRSKNVNAVMRE